MSKITDARVDSKGRVEITVKDRIGSMTNYLTMLCEIDSIEYEGPPAIGINGAKIKSGQWGSASVTMNVVRAPSVSPKRPKKRRPKS